VTHKSSHVIIQKVKAFVANHYGKILLFVGGFSGGAWFF